MSARGEPDDWPAEPARSEGTGSKFGESRRRAGAGLPGGGWGLGGRGQAGGRGAGCAAAYYCRRRRRGQRERDGWASVDLQGERGGRPACGPRAGGVLGGGRRAGLDG